MSEITLDLNLSLEHPQSDVIATIYQKEAIDLIPGKFYGQGRTEVDMEPTGQLSELAAEAAKLQTLPEIDRLYPLLDLLRSNIEYPYPQTVNDLEQKNPGLADWVQQNVLVGGNGGTSKVSELFKNGYAICNQLSVGYLWLAEQAGLKGVIAHDVGGIHNVTSPDTGLPLFKSVGLGEPVAPHSWVEIQTGDEWIPVDPSTKLAGTDVERFNTFDNAGYRAHLLLGGISTVDPNRSIQTANRIAELRPGSEEVAIDTRVELLPAKIKIGVKSAVVCPPEHTEFKGSATVSFHSILGDTALSFLRFPAAV